MSVVIVDMDKTRSLKNETFKNDEDVQARMMSLSDYLSIAKKTIGRFASPSLAKEMLKDEDAIAFIAENLMKATIRWKPDQGRTLYSYHNLCAIYAIKRWIDNKKSNSKYNILSLDSPVSSMESDSDMYNIVEDKRVNKKDNFLPEFEEILSKGNLNESQKECLRMRYVDNMTFSSIGNQLNKSSQRIEQIVKRAIEKLKEANIQLSY